jgi:hypothetical protein
VKDEVLAFVCLLCPFCRAKRRWPDSPYGRFMAKLERTCPFCRAYARVHGDAGMELKK